MGHCVPECVCVQMCFCARRRQMDGCYYINCTGRFVINTHDQVQGAVEKSVTSEALMAVRSCPSPGLLAAPPPTLPAPGADVPGPSSQVSIRCQCVEVGRSVSCQLRFMPCLNFSQPPADPRCPSSREHCCCCCCCCLSCCWVSRRGENQNQNQMYFTYTEENSVWNSKDSSLLGKNYEDKPNRRNMQ